MLRKILKDYRPVPWKIVEKETVDEIIFRTQDQRNRFILELMARGGMRIGEVLKLTPSDIDGGRISIQAPKSGRQTEVAVVPQKLAHRLVEYIRQRGTEPKDRIFSISYPAARMVVRKAGELVGISLKPHDLRTRAVTYASRAGTPIEITYGPHSIDLQRKFCYPPFQKKGFHLTLDSLAHPKVYALIHLPHCACHPRSREKELANIVNLGTIIMEMNLILGISILSLRSRLYGPGIS
jgi:hypothetical protein